MGRHCELKINRLSKSYGQQLVLDDLTFDVLKGEFLTILGPSGCGKTTLLKILIGMEHQDSGNIMQDNSDISLKNMGSRKMGIVFQNYALFENMTVRKNISYALNFSAELSSSKDQIVDELIEQMGLEDFENKYPRHLSGGQQQRVAIARTLALKPEIILFDEPLSALDVDIRNALRKEIKNIQKKYNTTMIFITHDQEEAFTLSDRIMVINDGKIQQIATPKEIIQNPANDFVKSFVIDNIQSKIDALMPFADVKRYE